MMLIYGVSDDAKGILDLARAAGVSVDGFMGGAGDLKEFAGLRVLGEEEGLNRAPGQITLAVTNPESRRVLSERFTALGWRLPALVHPRAIVAESARLAEGAVILAGAVVQPGATIGSGSIVGANAVVDSDATLEASARTRPLPAT
jgi:UDP-3-O-[3-hydroxymyristoyl] glucosamine N-acyltransferase